MNLENCYNEFNGNYAEVKARLLSEARIRKLLLLFLREPSFTQLQSAIAAGSRDEAIRAAHTLKGTALNMGFQKLSASSILVLTALRDGDMAGAAGLLPQVEQDYEATISAIRQYEASPEE